MGTEIYGLIFYVYFIYFLLKFRYQKFQNCDAPSYSPKALLRPPTSPPPPPPFKSDYAAPTETTYEPLWLDKFPRRENKGMFRVALVQALLAGIFFFLWSQLRWRSYL